MYLYIHTHKKNKVFRISKYVEFHKFTIGEHTETVKLPISFLPTAFLAMVTSVSDHLNVSGRWPKMFSAN